MRAILAVLLLLSLVLSGCAAGGGGKGDGDPTSTTSASQSGTSSSTTSASSSTTKSGTGSPATNRAPVASLAANVTSGAAPLRVNFTLGGTDPDGDALTYTLSFGDGSSNVTGSLPATGNHTFTVVGNHTVRLVVADGKLSNNATVSIGVLAGASGGIPPPVTFTGTATGVCQLFDPDFNDVCVPEDAAIELTFSMPTAVHQIVVALTWDMPVPTASDLDLYIYNEAGKEVGSSGCANVDPVPNQEIPVLGPPFGCVRGNSEEATITAISLANAETWKAVIDPYQAPAVDYTLTITYS